MFSLFGSNRPLVLSFLIVPAVLIVLCGIWLGTAADFPGGGPLSDLVHRMLSPYPGLIYILGILINLGSAILLNLISNKHDFGARENYFPALLYFLFASAYLEWTYLNPVLIANFFVLLSLRRLLENYRAVSVLSIGFDSALFLSVGVLFFPPISILFPLIWIVFIQSRTFNLKEWITPFTGIGVIAIYVFAGYYWNEAKLGLDEFLEFHGFSLAEIIAGPGYLTYFFTAFLLLIAGWGLLQFVADMGKSTLKKKNAKTIFLWLFFFFCITYFYTSSLSMDQPGLAGLFAIPIAVFTSFLFTGGTRKLIQRVIFYLWILFVIAFFILTNTN